MEQRVSLITLGVRDLARARRFYEEGLGWTRGNTDAEVAFYQAGGSIVALWDRAMLVGDAGLEADGSGFGGVALAHNTRSREEVDQLIAEAERAGARILVRPHETFWGGYNGYFADPDGHVWEVAWNPFWTVAEDGSVTLAKPE